MTMSLPPLIAEDVVLPVGKHSFSFRRLTWRDELMLARNNPDSTRVDALIEAMTGADGQHVTREQATRVISTMPKPIRERLVVLYLGSLPARRVFVTEDLYHAPEPTKQRPVTIHEDDEHLREADEAAEVDRRLGERILAAAPKQVAPPQAGADDDDVGSYTVVM